DLQFSDAQQQTLGVFEKDQLLQEIEQQHIKVVVREFDLACLARLNRLNVVDHHIRHRVSSVAKQFRQVASGCFKSDIGGAEFFEIFVRHGENDEIRMAHQIRMRNRKGV